MIAQGTMAFNSQQSPTADPYGVPQILVTLISFSAEYSYVVDLCTVDRIVPRRGKLDRRVVQV